MIILKKFVLINKKKRKKKKEVVNKVLKIIVNVMLYVFE